MTENPDQARTGHSFVMPGPVPGIHVFSAIVRSRRGWPGIGERHDAVL
jgi:hypothetical protein